MPWDIDDPDVRTAAIVARAWGVPLSTFTGQPVASVTTHAYNDAGQLIRSETVGPTWTDDDRQAAFDLARWEADLCPGCRQPMAETTDPANELRYQPQPPVRCHFCTAAERGGEKYQAVEAPSALHIPITLTAAPTRPAEAGDDDVRPAGDGTGGPAAPRAAAAEGQ